MTFISSDLIRSMFSAAMSEMYREEVPAYGTLIDLVRETNQRVLDQAPDFKAELQKTNSLERLSDERHGAIRLGTTAELFNMRRVFAVMGMFPVGYYDLSIAGVPVHSTAFRPKTMQALKRNPFRVFTSLLRLELIDDQRLRQTAQEVLAGRKIFTDHLLELTGKAEEQGGLSEADAQLFVQEALETFRWHSEAIVPLDLYHELHDAHRLIADIVSFKGPHINHLTPRTLDIDAVQALMPENGITPKAYVEGPPHRACPILLRQTSFKALEEKVSFEQDGSWREGTHTARFGEIEQRGLALTPKGRALYDELLGQVLEQADTSDVENYQNTLRRVFKDFPDEYETIRNEGLGYFEYDTDGHSHPVVYEDFLPVSAAGIFRSNLDDEAGNTFKEKSNQDEFETSLGAKVADPFELYQAMEDASRH